MSSFESSSFLSSSKINFINNFYKTSDQRDVEKYLNFLTSDVKFTMGSSAVIGEEAVRKIRAGLWNSVSTRLHTVNQVFVLDSQASQLMLNGTVDYGLDNGGKVQIGWAGRMIFEDSEAEEGNLKLSSYRVWLDTAPLVAALKA